MRLRWLFVASLLVILCLIPVAAWAQGSDPSTWPIVYQDNFQDPKSGWEVSKGADVVKAYVDGTYEIQVQTGNTIAWSFVPTDKDYLDFSAQVKVRSAGNDGEFGIMFRYVDYDNFYCFTVHTDGTYRLWMQKAGEWQTLIDWTPIPGFDPNKGHTLRVETQGNQFTFFLDGARLTQFSDGTFRGGKLALAVGTFAEPFSARFDNLVVREDPEIRTLADQAQDLINQGDAAYSAWRFETAKEKYAQAAEIYGKLTWRSRQANAELSLGNSCYLLSAYQEAIKHYQTALSLYRVTGDRGRPDPHAVLPSLLTTAKKQGRNSVVQST